MRHAARPSGNHGHGNGDDKGNHGFDRRERRERHWQGHANGKERYFSKTACDYVRRSYEAK